MLQVPWCRSPRTLSRFAEECCSWHLPKPGGPCTVTSPTRRVNVEECQKDHHAKLSLRSIISRSVLPALRLPLKGLRRWHFRTLEAKWLEANWHEPWADAHSGKSSKVILTNGCYTIKEKCGERALDSVLLNTFQKVKCVKISMWTFVFNSIWTFPVWGSAAGYIRHLIPKWCCAGIVTQWSCIARLCVYSVARGAREGPRHGNHLAHTATKFQRRVEVGLTCLGEAKSKVFGKECFQLTMFFLFDGFRWWFQLFSLFSDGFQWCSILFTEFQRFFNDSQGCQCPRS